MPNRKSTTYPLIESVSFLLSTLLVLAAVGCSTTPIPTFEPIPVPQGLSTEQVEVSILAALANTPVPKELSEGVDIADRALTAFFGPLRYQSVRSSRNQEWYPESRKPGQIVAGLNVRSHYLQVRLDFDKSTVQPSISSSRNLKQSETRIHERAVEWAHSLEDRIRRSLGFMSAYGTKNTAQ